MNRAEYIEKVRNEIYEQLTLTLAEGPAWRVSNNITRNLLVKELLKVPLNPDRKLQETLDGTQKLG
jgi:hypothetical protein